MARGSGEHKREISIIRLQTLLGTLMDEEGEREGRRKRRREEDILFKRRPSIF
jgi:hypothetical protein